MIVYIILRFTDSDALPTHVDSAFSSESRADNLCVVLNSKHNANGMYSYVVKAVLLNQESSTVATAA